MMCAISCYIRPRYNSTWLYMMESLSLSLYIYQLIPPSHNLNKRQRNYLMHICITRLEIIKWYIARKLHVYFRYRACRDFKVALPGSAPEWRTDFVTLKSVMFSSQELLMWKVFWWHESESKSVLLSDAFMHHWRLSNDALLRNCMFTLNIWDRNLKSQSVAAEFSKEFVTLNAAVSFQTLLIMWMKTVYFCRKPTNQIPIMSF